MKICFFINTLSSGGAERQLCYLANFLNEKGHAISIVTYGDLDDHYSLNNGVERIHIYPEKHNIIKLWGIFRFFFDSKHDAVISFCQQNNLLSCLSLIFNSIPMLIVGERNYTIGAPNFKEKILFKYLYKRAKAIVPNSLSQARHIEQYFPLLKNKTIVITNYTDTSVFNSQHKNKGDINSLRICVIARYSSQKNYKRLALCAHRLNQLGYKFIIDWHGRNTDDSGKYLKSYTELCSIIKEHSLDDVFKLHGSTSNIAELLHHYDVFCLPSIYEGFSNALSEAISSGLPILASNVSDNSLMVKEGINGFLFNPESEDDMEKAFISLFSTSKNKLFDMGIASRQIAESLFNKESFVNSYLNIINNKHENSD